MSNPDFLEARPNPQPGLFDSNDPAVLTISELTGRIKFVLEERFTGLRVEGEVSNFKRHSSGHCYFTLKDRDAQIRCVMWRGMTRYLFFKPADGMLVRVVGDVSVYEMRGEYQIVVRQMKPAGDGTLAQAFEALKRKLAAEGLFEEAHKQPLPRFPERIAIVTSRSAAALQDILSVLERRFPLVTVLLYPVQVQGFSAADEIAAAIRFFGRHAGPKGDPAFSTDIVIVARGGGTAEDLWAFNEEAVARAIFDCPVPTISAVGHETDFSIADFVADRRAATPSMAAELAVPDRRDIESLIQGFAVLYRERMMRHIRDRRQRVEFLTGSYLFNRPIDRLRQSQQRVDDLSERVARALGRCIEKYRDRVSSLDRRLFALDPNRPLEQGYALVERNARRITSASELSPHDMLTIHFRDGQRKAVVEG